MATEAMISTPASATATKPESAAAAWRRTIPETYTVRFSNGAEETYGEGLPAFTLIVRDRRQMLDLFSSDTYSAALSFIRGDFNVEGDLVAAVRFQLNRHRRGWRDLLYAAAARLAPHRIETWLQTRARAAENIRYHYDRSNEFYKQFLDSRMVYSCAYFQTPGASLEEAQVAKLDHICRKLDLRPGDRFLDIGCGWGSLVIHAAGRYGAQAIGCTLSRNQTEYARESARRVTGAEVAIHEMDFREMSGRFDKIASVGMFEHVGRHRLRSYFRKVHDLLEPDGLFLNHGLVRPEFVTDCAQTLFLQRRVFPGGELAHLSDVIRTAELAGFEILDVEDLRPHYALTCRAWVGRLQRNADACLDAVDRETYRTWLLYLAGSAASFEDGLTGVSQLLLAKRSSPARRLTREYMCAGANGPARAPESIS
ncbi:MAG TPA: cyclopropane-fatty-acyl-phospholipid synthase family protein [Bryobacteraceae bacterium]|nr:cyclopropane-fatty-acyl-phospholipid synthase family protein [Bryobacteraceae bacterium]